MSPAAEISLTWTASSDPRSYVSYYNVYRNGSLLGTSTTTSYVDTTISYGVNYTYAVAAVNHDGYESTLSTAVALSLPCVIENEEPTTTEIEIYFNEPLTAGPAATKGNYTVSATVSGTNVTVSAVAVSRDNTLVTLTLASNMALSTSYTVTMKNLTAVSGDPLPATQTFSFTYVSQGTGSILWQSYGNLGSNPSLSTLTGAAIYPNDPTQTGMESSFEAPHATGNTDYGETLSGYVYPPTTGSYIFTIASNDASELWLSTNNSPANVSEIAYVSNGTGYRNWSDAAEPEQSSVSIYLDAGHAYYIVAMGVYGTDNGANDDNLSVRWEIPSTSGGAANTWEQNGSGNPDQTIPIPGIRLSPPTNTAVDSTTPPAPTNLRATVTGSNNQITLAWSPVLGLPSGVNNYNIYRNGSLLGTSTTTSYVDSNNISSATRYTYQVQAVNFDGVAGVESAPVTAVPVGIASLTTPSTTSVQINFTEPVDPTSATNPANYSIPGVTISTTTPPVLQSDGYTVTLTTSALGTSVHTLTITSVKNQSLAALPSLSSSFTYASASGYTAPPFTVGIGAESTNGTSPALSGTVSDPAASVAVRVNGSYYAATNSGEGTWSLPQGDIATLSAGTCDVVVVGVNTSSVAAFAPTTNQLVVATASPTATSLPPRAPPARQSARSPSNSTSRWKTSRWRTWC